MSKIFKESIYNTEIKEEDVLNIFLKYNLNIKINNIMIYQNAFIHKSMNKPKTYERYELLGDSILNFVIVSYLYKRFPSIPEGPITQLKIKIIKGETLGKIALKMELNKFLLISQHVETESGRDNIRLLEDIFEAFIGAIFLDNGDDIEKDEMIHLFNRKNELLFEINKKKGDSINIELYEEYINVTEKILSTSNNGFLYCQRFIINVIEKEIDLVSLTTTNDNYKDQLQHYYQKIYSGKIPEWELIEITGPPNNRIHTIIIRDDKGAIIGKGVHRKKRTAEQLASKEAIEALTTIIEL